MIPRETMIGIFTGVGTSTGMMMASKSKKKEVHYALYGIAGGMVGTVLGALLCSLTHKENAQKPSGPSLNP